MSPFAYLTSVSILVYLVSTSNAAPWPAYSKHSTHRTRLIGGRQLESYHPKSTFKTFGSAGTSVASPSQSSFKVPTATSAQTYFKSLGIEGADPNYTAGFTVGSTRHEYLKQSYNGIPISNAVGNVVFNKDSQVVSYASSFIDVASATFASSSATLPWQPIQTTLEATFPAKLPHGSTPSLEYLVNPDGSVSLTYVFQLRNPETGAAYQVFVCAHSGEIKGVTDFVAHATYAAVPMTEASADEGIQVIENPNDRFDWHNVSGQNTTSGNNAIVATYGSSLTSSETQQQSANKTFTDLYNDTLDPSNATNANAARANAFYVVNSFHDVAYRYGFTEAAGNFELDDAGKGGKGNDPVEVYVQMEGAIDRTGFTSLPDGEPGYLMMYPYNHTTPPRHSAMSNDVLIHELTHGLTNRMTGGGTASCLQTTEAGGLGEGWSDAMAGWFQQTSEETKDFVIGAWLTNTTQGLRRYPYSVNAATNPLRYSSLKGPNDIHSIGEIWANMLHNVYAELVGGFGFSPDKLTNPDASEGNVVWMRLFVDALPLQPCNPTFVQARDAWIQADANRYNGVHKCRIMKAFASRGLGTGAGPTYDDDGSVPSGCSSAEPSRLEF